MKIPYYMAKAFVSKHAKFIRHDELLNVDIWLRQGSVVITLDHDKPVYYEHLHMIAVDQLGVSIHEFDYWLGENNIC